MDGQPNEYESLLLSTLPFAPRSVCAVTAAARLASLSPPTLSWHRPLSGPPEYGSMPAALLYRTSGNCKQHYMYYILPIHSFNQRLYSLPICSVSLQHFYINQQINHNFRINAVKESDLIANLTF